MTNNDELALSRKEFEAIYNETHSVEITPAFKRFGYYTSPIMQKAWELWQQAQKSLLAERDADKKRIAELESLIAEQDERLITYSAIATKNANPASEERTVSVKLPKPHAHLIWIQAGYPPDDYWDDVAVSHSVKDRCCDGSERYPVYSIFEIQDACAAAGIKLEVEE